MTSDQSRQLEELKHLHEQGILDDEAYQAARVRLAESVLTEPAPATPPPPAVSGPSVTASRRGLTVRFAGSTPQQKALIGCLLVVGLCTVCGVCGQLLERVAEDQRSGTVTPSASRSNRSSSSRGTADSRSGAAPEHTATAGPPTKSAQELLSLVDEHWSKSDWDAIVTLLEDNPVTRGDAALKEKLYAALINQGQGRADAKNFTGAESSFTKAQSLDAARGIAQTKLAEITAQQVQEGMKEFTGEGSASVAVSEVIAQGYFNTGFGTYRPNDPKTSQYLLVSVAVMNRSRREISTNPLYFTLLTDGYTMNPESEMYTMSNHFDATDLQPGAYATGWLLFLAPKAESYTLVYHGFLDDTIRKEIVVTERR